MLKEKKMLVALLNDEKIDNSKIPKDDRDNTPDFESVRKTLGGKNESSVFSALDNISGNTNGSKLPKSDDYNPQTDWKTNISGISNVPSQKTDLDEIFAPSYTYKCQGGGSFNVIPNVDLIAKLRSVGA